MRSEVSNARGGGLRTLLLAAWLAAAALAIVHAAPLGPTLVALRYAGYTALAALFAASCVAAGHRVLAAIARPALPPDEHLVVAAAVGVYAWTLATFVAGLAGVLGRPFAIALPAACLLAGGPHLVRWARRWRTRLCAAAVPPRRASAATRAAFAFGAVGLALAWVQVLTPGNVGYDARWYHLPIAESYAAAGAIRPFGDGFFQGAFPQLSSLVYLWAFELFPRTCTFDRVELAAHLELALFVLTLASVPTLVRRLVPRARGSASWAAMFLFPSVLLYDGSLFGGSDHVLAFFAIPAWLAARRAVRRLSVRACLVLAIVLAGAFLTKYQAALIAAGPLVALAFRAARGALRPADRRGGAGAGGRGAMRAVATLAAALVLLTAPHWAKNLAWYGDPLYPALHRYLADHPWTEDAPHLVRAGLESGSLWQPTGPLWHRVAETARAVVTFAFEPHDFTAYHGDEPVFGFLFTLLAPALLVVRGGRRALPLVLATVLGVTVWYVMSHYDRYLQAIVPWMAAVVAAACIRLWRGRATVRIALAAAVGAQIATGAHVPFIPAGDDSFEIARPSPYVAAAELATHVAHGDARLEVSPRWERFGAELPDDAVVLAHHRDLRLGIGTRSVYDRNGWQGGLAYGRLGTARAVHAKLRALGVTHVVYEPWLARGFDSLAGDLVFHDFALRALEPLDRDGELALARVTSEAPPPAADEDRVAIAACHPRPSLDVWRLSDLNFPVDGAPDPVPVESSVEPERALAVARFAVTEDGCAPPFDPKGHGLRWLVRRGAYELWARP